MLLKRVVQELRLGHLLPPLQPLPLIHAPEACFRKHDAIKSTCIEEHTNTSEPFVSRIGGKGGGGFAPRSCIRSHQDEPPQRRVKGLVFTNEGCSFWQVLVRYLGGRLGKMSVVIKRAHLSSARKLAQGRTQALRKLSLGDVYSKLQVDPPHLPVKPAQGWRKGEAQGILLGSHGTRI